jgi:hypothetical protein
MTSKRIKGGLVVLFLVGFTCTALWLGTSRSVQGSTSSAVQADVQSIHPFTRLDYKAKAAKGVDPVAIGDLTEETFTTFALTDIPPFTQENMKDRVARAELNYRHGMDRGIPEFKVAKTVNELALKLDVPDYARVTPAMVRAVRVGLMLEMPNFIAQDDPSHKKGKRKIGSSINPFMSPLEATAITLFLLQQKAVNDAFQVSHEQFFADRHQKQLQKWGEWRAQKDGNLIDNEQTERQPDQKLRVVSSKSKIDNPKRAAKRAAEAMNPDALLNLGDSSLDTLGIKR